MAFPHAGQAATALGLAASNVASSYMRFYGEKFEWPKFLVETMKGVPWPPISGSTATELAEIAREQVDQRRSAYQTYEPFLEFTCPPERGARSIVDPLAFDRLSLLGSGLDCAIAYAYGLNTQEYEELVRDLREAVIAVTRFRGAEERSDENEDDRDRADFFIGDSPRDRNESLLSYALGVSFGRWDVRIGRDPSLAPKLAGAFAPLPVCSPGMLVGSDGLPAQPDAIVSEAWLRARPDAATVPAEGTMQPCVISDEEYPLRIPWDGVLVDDPDQLDDIAHRIREVLALLRPDGASALEQEACELLGVADLRAYLRRPGLFFADHLKRYSKSRRQAPIYWPLSTKSGSYTIWLYYSRLTSDTLFTAVNRYVQPKIVDVERQFQEARAAQGSASGRDKSRLLTRVEELSTFLAELHEFRDELKRVTELPYRPNLDDGVIINAAPLYKLFRLPKWAKDAREVWQKLERGDYDWAHLAFTIWPERVCEKCRSDRSLAIAHDLEDLYSGPPPGAGRKARARTQVAMDDNDDE